jgi:serine/threonine protein kinase
VASPSQDVWALGVIVYEALTGTKALPPFTDPEAVLGAAADGKLTFPWEHSPLHVDFERSKVSD